MFFFLPWLSTFHMLMIFKGLDTVRPIPPPEELVFTVDEKVRSDISHAKQQYLESVSWYTKSNYLRESLMLSDLYITTVVVSFHSVAGFIDKGPAGFVLRLYSFRKSRHQTDKAAPGHLHSTSNAAGLLQNEQKVCTCLLDQVNSMFWVQEVNDLRFSFLPLRPGSCYETAMTRKFYHGRTETMRPCTNEALNWCTAMMDPTCDVSIVLLKACDVIRPL